MKKPLFHTLCIYAALVLWLFASVSGMHGRHCLDGLEPPVSVHFDLLDSREDSHEESQAGHQDVENKAQVSALKLGNMDTLFFAALLWIACVWPLVRGQSYFLFKTPRAWLDTTGLRPPLRPPPIPLH
ncbi:MAG TPA: hypothetical protein PKD17_09840 [Cellvibrionaceae bacterium]|nr:hypothetical protein [Cellvibrionaceae bacterium]HMW72111.1 hypothetical protein [Cellvibrionaceae bacterium]